MKLYLYIHPCVRLICCIKDFFYIFCSSGKQMRRHDILLRAYIFPHLLGSLPDKHCRNLTIANLKSHWNNLPNVWSNNCSGTKPSLHRFIFLGQKCFWIHQWRTRTIMVNKMKNISFQKNIFLIFNKLAYLVRNILLTRLNSDFESIHQHISLFEK